MPTIKERLSQVLSEARTLHLKGALAGDDATRFTALVGEAETLKGQIETTDRLDAVADFAGKSAGMLPLAGDEAPVGQVAVTGFAPAGKSLVERTAEEIGGNRARYSIKLLDQYGEGIYSNKSLERFGTTEYRDAFRSYLRRPQHMLKSAELKVLQEGIDTEGGFAVPLDLLDRVIAKEPTPTRVAGRVTNLQTSRDMLKVPRINYSTDDLYSSGIRVAVCCAA